MVWPVHTIPPVEHRLVLPSLAAEIEVTAVFRRWYAEHTDRQELLQPAANPVAPGSRGEIGLSDCILPLGPEFGLWRVTVFQPTIRVSDDFAVEDIGYVSGWGVGIGGHIKSVNGER